MASSSWPTRLKWLRIEWYLDGELVVGFRKFLENLQKMKIVLPALPLFLPEKILPRTSILGIFLLQ